MFSPVTSPGVSQTTSCAKRPDHSRLSSPIPAGLTLLIHEAAEHRRHPGKKAREHSGQLAKQRLSLLARDVIPPELLPISKNPAIQTSIASLSPGKLGLNRPAERCLCRWFTSERTGQQHQAFREHRCLAYQVYVLAQVVYFP
jgi:hypothetical protein